MASVAEFKAIVAEKYASVQALAASEARLAAAVEGMRLDDRAAVGDLTSRIDRILSTMQGQH
ncbi:hypothetical protein [Bradyrhizobium lablabi]|uniref:hypothetical protein n=1 Tax=Bradyrhizobium lablabi TaxID=722472 RepID=UPI001BAABAAA|nr:hypothetical protein [Bradyrhizobium lablabi]MBR0693261.1 hypothetical protein [Bradyrhizobium lablabi]